MDSRDGIYLFKISNGNMKEIRKICSKLTSKTPEQLQCFCGIFQKCFAFSIADFKQARAGCAELILKNMMRSSALTSALVKLKAVFRATDEL